MLALHLRDYISKDRAQRKSQRPALAAIPANRPPTDFPPRNSGKLAASGLEAPLSSPPAAPGGSSGERVAREECWRASERITALEAELAAARRAKAAAEAAAGDWRARYEAERAKRVAAGAWLQRTIQRTAVGVSSDGATAAAAVVAGLRAELEACQRALLQVLSAPSRLGNELLTQACEGTLALQLRVARAEAAPEAREAALLGWALAKWRSAAQVVGALGELNDR